MRRRTIVVGAVIGALLVVGGMFIEIQDGPETRFPTRATATYAAGSSVSTFKSVGEFVATATFVVEGEVLEVRRGAPIQLADGTGSEIVPRLLLVQVIDLLHSRETQAATPDTLLVTDGYWEDGVGYERESTGWAMPGQTGFFVLRQDHAPDGTLMSTYSPLDGTGIVLVDRDQVNFAHEGVWHALGRATTTAEFRNALARGISAARSGAAKPVPVTICRPSVPGDEKSKPICVEE